MDKNELSVFCAILPYDPRRTIEILDLIYRGIPRQWLADQLLEEYMLEMIQADTQCIQFSSSWGSPAVCFSVGNCCSHTHFVFPPFLVTFSLTVDPSVYNWIQGIAVVPRGPHFNADDVVRFCFVLQLIHRDASWLFLRKRWGTLHKRYFSGENVCDMLVLS